MKKLTLVSVSSNGIRFSLFVNALCENGKAIVSNETINEMLKQIGVCSRGQTYSVS